MIHTLLGLLYRGHFVPTVRVSPRKEKRCKRATSLGPQWGHDFTISIVPSESFYCVPTYGASTVQYCNVVVVELVDLFWKSKVDRGDFFSLLACVFITRMVGGKGSCQIPAHARIVFGAGLLLLADAERNDAGCLRPSRMVRAANKHRDKVAWKAKLVVWVSGKEFRRQFKIGRRRFGWIADKIAPHVEPTNWGKVLAV